MKLSKKITLTVSIVIYRPNMAYLVETLSSIQKAIAYAMNRGVICKAHIFLINNGSSKDVLRFIECYVHRMHKETEICGTVLSGHGNIGYGCGHNIGIEKSSGDYYLILNPDVALESESILNGIQFLEQNRDVGLVVPIVLNDKKEKSHLCKRYPDVFSLFLRGFAPKAIKKFFKYQLDSYDMTDIDLNQANKDVAIASGCFMLFEESVLNQICGFDPRYFLYFEDFDLSIKTRKFSRIALLPQMRIFHYGGHTTHKGWRHIKYFISSVFTFFNTNGWKWL